MHSRRIQISLKRIKSNQEGEIQALHIKSNKKRKLKYNKKESNKSYKQRDWSKVRCFKCDKNDHPHKFCPKKKRIQAALAEIKEEGEEKEERENYVFYLALSSELNSNHNTWIIDSGASCDTTGFKDKFETFTDQASEEVTIGDNSTHPIKGIGSCLIQLNSGIIQLKNVLYVLGIKRNLVSISGLVNQGFRITF